ncbi:hypothetical protein SCLCIDRAFT_1222491 [Scleroderma citrinum Foug A]|uniref:Uncharacterized protein n=1 Tax=Scleroderma citrinum Foug A TaxID=1036808 RepID=A0A0C2ZMK3_9AGAM|nr:hypothetical protein SCLCIDRAFT_1222491 [Scleroderma citrinum Foug A]
MSVLPPLPGAQIQGSTNQAAPRERPNDRLQHTLEDIPSLYLQSGTLLALCGAYTWISCMWSCSLCHVICFAAHATADNVVKIWSIRNLSGHTKGLSDLMVERWDMPCFRIGRYEYTNMEHRNSLDNKSSTGTYKLRILCQLQLCVEPISLRWMRRRGAYMEHRERKMH